MARVTGPLMSVDASGQFGKSLVFAKWKGRNYVRKLVIPANPDSAAQKGVRAMMSFLAAGWKSLGAPAKASWATIAAAASFSPFNAYVQTGLKRWRQFLPPAQATPVAGAHTAATLSGTSATGGVGHAVIAATLNTTSNIWGVVIARAAASISIPNWDNVVHVAPVPATTTFTWTDSGLAAGTYHYRIATITDDGIIGAFCTDFNGTVT